MGTVFRYALRRCRRVAAAVFPVLAGGPVSWMIFRYATSRGMAHGFRCACGVRSAGVRSCFRRDVVSGSRLPVPVPGCRGCGKCMEPFAGLSIRPAILSGACAAIPDRSGFSTLFRSAGSGGGVCPAFGDVRGYAGISVNGALPGMAHGGHAGGIKKSLMK